MCLGSHPQTVPSGFYSKSSDSLQRDGKRHSHTSGFGFSAFSEVLALISANYKQIAFFFALSELLQGLLCALCGKQTLNLE
jgi:hypothetical protein